MFEESEREGNRSQTTETAVLTHCCRYGVQFFKFYSFAQTYQSQFPFRLVRPSFFFVFPLFSNDIHALSHRFGFTQLKL